MVKNLPAKRETRVRSLGWEDPLAKGNGSSLWYSCLENRMDRGAWRATVPGVADGWAGLSMSRSCHFQVSMRGGPAVSWLQRVLL